MSNFNGFVGVIGQKLPSDSTLRSMKKSELIHFLHVAEHNYNALVERYGRVVALLERSGSVDLTDIDRSDGDERD